MVEFLKTVVDIIVDLIFDYFIFALICIVPALLLLFFTPVSLEDFSIVFLYSSTALVLFKRAIQYMLSN